MSTHTNKVINPVSPHITHFYKHLVFSTLFSFICISLSGCYSLFETSTQNPYENKQQLNKHNATAHTTKTTNQNVDGDTHIYTSEGQKAPLKFD